MLSTNGNVGGDSIVMVIKRYVARNDALGYK
jgi:hypothetical protein